MTKWNPNTESVTMTKGTDGWKAESWLLIGGDRYLQITTRKTSSGLRSTAHGITVTDMGFTWEMFSAFKEELARSNARCTEKAIKELHATATKDTGPVLERAIGFYAVKEAMQAIAGLSLDLSERACAPEAMGAAA